MELGARTGDALTVEHAGSRHAARYALAFGDVAPGELLLYEDAWGALALAVNRGHAAAMLGVVPDGEVRLTKR